MKLSVILNQNAHGVANNYLKQASGANPRYEEEKQWPLTK